MSLSSTTETCAAEMLFAEPLPAEGLSKPEIAGLTVIDIIGMTRNQLKQVIRSVQRPFRGQNVDDRLDFLDRTTLERLAYLSRRCARSQGY